MEVCGELTGTVGFEHATVNLRHGAHMRITGNVPHRTARAHLRIPRTKHNAPHMSAHRRSRAHRAGFQRHDERTIRKIPRAQRTSCRTHRLNLSVGQRITMHLAHIAARRNHRATGVQHHRANRHVSSNSRGLRLTQRLAHRAFIRRALLGIRAHRNRRVCADICVRGIVCSHVCGHLHGRDHSRARSLRNPSLVICHATMLSKPEPQPAPSHRPHPLLRNPRSHQSRTPHLSAELHRRSILKA